MDKLELKLEDGSLPPLVRKLYPIAYKQVLTKYWQSKSEGLIQTTKIAIVLPSRPISKILDLSYIEK